MILVVQYANQMNSFEPSAQSPLCLGMDSRIQIDEESLELNPTLPKDKTSFTDSKQQIVCFSWFAKFPNSWEKI